MRQIDPDEVKGLSQTKQSGKNGYQFEAGHIVRAAVLAPVVAVQQKSTDLKYLRGTPRSNPGNAIHTPDWQRDNEGRLEEAVGLASAIDLEIVQKFLFRLPRARPATLFGSGKVEELSGVIKAEEIELVIVDHVLTPIQQRNLERAWSVKVLDRTGLILEIFGQRAKTREGRLQVELAHLTYQKSRLVRSWTHLERQRGGFGFLGGPGETQIEADRRQIQGRIQKIERELDRVKRTRKLHRKGRKRVPFPVAALVGYTNAGKSTLFNHLTGAEVTAEDQLFATLDPTMREVCLESGHKIIVSDTVGFISDLPTPLIRAFHATLEEVLEADLIIHVRDIHSHETEVQYHDVIAVLEEIGIDFNDSGTRVIEVWNKIDLLDGETRETLQNRAANAKTVPCVPVSATTGEGIDKFLSLLDRTISETGRLVQISVPAGSGGLLNWLYKNADVLDRSYADNGAARLKVRINPTGLGRLHHWQGKHPELVIKESV